MDNDLIKKVAPIGSCWLARNVLANIYVVDGYGTRYGDDQVLFTIWRRGISELKGDPHEGSAEVGSILNSYGDKNFPFWRRVDPHILCLLEPCPKCESHEASDEDYLCVSCRFGSEVPTVGTSG